MGIHSVNSKTIFIEDKNLQSLQKSFSIVIVILPFIGFILTIVDAFFHGIMLRNLLLLFIEAGS